MAGDLNVSRWVDEAVELEASEAVCAESAAEVFMPALLLIAFPVIVNALTAVLLVALAQRLGSLSDANDTFYYLTMCLLHSAFRTTLPAASVAALRAVLGGPVALPAAVRSRLTGRPYEPRLQPSAPHLQVPPAGQAYPLPPPPAPLQLHQLPSHPPF